MASQPIFAPYTPLPTAAPRPNIRIAYIAGDASIAIHRGMGDFPPAVRESTLEELAIAGLTDELIAAAAKLLSPAMYAAFLRWGEAASHFASYYVTDEDGLDRSAATCSAIEAITALTAANAHDAALKTHLLTIEAGDCPDFGPVSSNNADGARIPLLIDSVTSDLCTLSPVVALLEDLAKLAWSASGIPASSFTVEIGAIITGAFRSASEAMGLDIPAPARLPAVLEGYSPFMRGPLVAWRKAYALYEAAAAELAAYERNTYRPTAYRYTEARGDIQQPLTPEIEALLEAIPMDDVQDRFDELVTAEHEASTRLWALPAPSAAELATKLKIFHKAEGWDLTYAGWVLDRITADARRFGRHGAFVQQDQSLIAAYAGLRQKAAEWFVNGAFGDERDDAEDAIVAAFEKEFWQGSASTVEGVIARLRVAFQHIVGESWSDRAVLDPKHADFVEGLKDADGNHQVLWGAIEDLARIGGINLTEQGA